MFHRRGAGQHERRQRGFKPPSRRLLGIWEAQGKWIPLGGFLSKCHDLAEALDSCMLYRPVTLKGDSKASEITPDDPEWTLRFAPLQLYTGIHILAILDQ